MKKFAFPIQLHSGLNYYLAQPYGDEKLVAWYKANGVDINRHNGADLALLGRPDQTYGTALICPFPKGKVVKTWWENPMSSKGNGIMIQSEPFEEDGVTKIIQFLFWHCSEIVTSKTDFIEGETIAYVGNSGLVTPKPTIGCPYCGSHLHLGCFEYWLVNGVWTLQNADNGLGGAIDPMLRIDVSKIYRATDTGFVKDLPPVKWAIEQIKSLLRAFGIKVDDL